LTSYFWLIWEILENDIIQMTRKKSLSGVLLDMSSKNNETIACMKQQKYKKWLFLWNNDRPEATKTPFSLTTG
jgi:hypothetical protein